MGELIDSKMVLTCFGFGIKTVEEKWKYTMLWYKNYTVYTMDFVDEYVLNPVIVTFLVLAVVSVSLKFSKEDKLSYEITLP